MAYTTQFREMILDSDPGFLDFWSSDKKKNGERKGGICLDKENIFLPGEMKNGEGMRDNIWRRNLYLFIAEEKKNGEGK